jgi:hypothetical protein
VGRGQGSKPQAKLSAIDSAHTGAPLNAADNSVSEGYGLQPVLIWLKQVRL